MQALLRPVAGHDLVGIIIGGELVFDVRFLFRVGNCDRVRRSFGALESVRHRERDVLAVVANDIVFKGWPPLDADAVHPLPQGRTGDFADVLAMKDRAHARHLFRRRSIELGDLAVCDRGLDRHGI